MRQYCSVLMATWVARWLFLLVGLAWAVGVSAQSGYNAFEEMGMPAMRNYSSFEFKGKPQNFAVVQDKQGLIYVGNENGVLQFDGFNWRSIPVKNFSTVRSLAVSDDGTVFVGGEGEFGFLKPNDIGLLRYESLIQDKNLTRSFKPKDKRFGEVWQTVVIGAEVYFVTDSLLFKYFNNSLTIIRPELSFDKAFTIGKELYIVDGDRGLTRISANKVKLLDDARFDFDAEDIRAAIPYGSQEVLLVTDKTGIFIFNRSSRRSSRFAAPAVADFLRQNKATSGVRLQDGNFAVATKRGGIVIFNGNGNLLKTIDKKEGLQDNFVFDMYQSSQGALWLALDKGITRIDLGSGVSYFSDRNGLEGSLVQAVQRYNGSIYAATGRGVYYREAETGRDFKVVGGISSKSFSLAIAENDLLAATDDGVYQIRDGSADHINSDNISKDYEVSAYQIVPSQTRPNTIYVPNTSGLAVLRKIGGRWKFTEQIARLTTDVYTAVEAADGSLWLWTGFNFLLHAETSSDSWETPVLSRYDSVKGLKADVVREIYQYEGAVLVATNKGVFKFNPSTKRFEADKRFGETITSGEMLVSAFQPAPNGDAWLYARNDKTYQILKYAKSGGKTEPVSTLNRRNLSVSCFFPESNGTIWIGCDDRLVRFDGGSVQKQDKEPFPALIRRVKIGATGDSTIFWGAFLDINNRFVSNKQSEGQVPIIAYKYNTIRFECALPNYSNAEGHEFRYKIDDEWSAWSDQPFKEFTKIRPGTYTLKVEARNAGSTIVQETEYRFIVKSPFYLSTWAYLLYVLSGVGLIYLLFRWRLSALERQKRELEAIVRERTAEVMKQRDELEKQNKELEQKNYQIREQIEELRQLNEEITVQRDQIEEANTMLLDANEKIKQQQDEIVQAERMTAVSEILPILAHEINTPLRAMYDSVGILLSSLPDIIRNMSEFIPNLGAPKTASFWELANRIRDNIAKSPALSTGEERQLRKKLESKLEDADVEDADYYAEKIVKIGAFDYADSFMPFLTGDTAGRKTMDAANNYGVVFKQLSSMEGQITKARKKVQAMMSYFKEDNNTGAAPLAALAEGIELALELYEYYLAQGFKLETSFDPSVSRLRFPLELTQVWSHLIMNIVRQAGGGQVKIQIAPDGQWINVSFTDQRATPLSERALYFYSGARNSNPFYDNATDLTHDEIRLSIARKLVESFGGRTFAQSQPGSVTLQVMFPQSAGLEPANGEILGWQEK